MRSYCYGRKFGFNKKDALLLQSHIGSTGYNADIESGQNCGFSNLKQLFPDGLSQGQHLSVLVRQQ
jgi:hypothetical protein